MKIKGILLAGHTFQRKDGSGNCLSISFVCNTDTLEKCKIITMFSGADYLGGFDLSGFKPFDDIEIEYNQEIGSQYISLINFRKVK